MAFVPGSPAPAVVALWRLDRAARTTVLAGAGGSLLGVMAVMGLGNVPMNTRLDALSRSPEGVTGYWPAFALRRTRLNHLRVAASGCAAAAWLAAAQLV